MPEPIAVLLGRSSLPAGGRVFSDALRLSVLPLHTVLRLQLGARSQKTASTLRVAYGTSKAALMHLTKQQALELGAMGVRVNAIAPGPVDTAMAKQVHTASIRADYHEAIPLNRYGEEREMAEAVFFLCSDAASYVNGQTLAVDGGFDASGIGLKVLRRRS